MGIEDFFRGVTRGESEHLFKTYTLNKKAFDSNMALFDNKKGVYAWYLMPSDTDSSGLKDYYKIFNNKIFSAKFSSKFNEEYHGDNIKHKDEGENQQYINNKSFVSNESLALKFSALFMSPPVYIGQSTNLKDRLDTHFAELNTKIGTSEEALKAEMDGDENNYENLDKRFASRICYQLKSGNNRNNWNIDNFIVRVMLFKDTDMSAEKVEHVEGILNRTFKPIMGKR